MARDSTERVHHCPHCGGKNVQRTRKVGFLEAATYWIFRIHPYVCSDCGRKFVDRVLTHRDSAL
ncbi:MAG: hypothetical protein WA002_15595 [Candidatus Acidiferrales bacterium]